MVAIARRIPTPAQIVTHLDLHVVGQHQAKRQLSNNLYQHFLGLAAIGKVAGFDDAGRNHQLLLGPTGVGKSLLVKTAARYLGVPVAFMAAPSLVETGYVGTPVEAMFQTLLERAGGDIALAEQGIVFLDEFDKLKRAPDVSRDVSGEGVQNGLLTLMDGRPVRLRYRDKDLLLDSSRILFLCTGAFSGLTARVATRLERGGRAALGFTAGSSVRRQWAEYELLEKVLPQDLVEYGFIPELVARFAGFIKLQALTQDEMLQVLCDVEGSPLRRKYRFFKLHGVHLELTACGRQALVERALAQGLGARALDHVMQESLADIEYRLPNLHAQDIGTVRLTREVVLGERTAELLPRLAARNADDSPPPAEAIRRAGLGRPAPTPEPGPQRQKEPPQKPKPETRPRPEGPTLFSPD
jgi:ATP-dependent Clp protease ATP-binding subunit ClpX